MPECHTRTRETHDLLYLILHTWFVAMDRTILAGGLTFLIRTKVESIQGVILDFRTLGTISNLQLVMMLTVDTHHDFDGGCFTFNSICNNGHRGQVILLNGRHSSLTPEVILLPQSVFYHKEIICFRKFFHKTESSLLHHSSRCGI